MKLRFSIRDLLWLTLVVALAVGWWAYSRRTPAVQKWEYQIRHGITEERTLNEFGEQGWDLCSMEGDRAVLKRPKR